MMHRLDLSRRSPTIFSAAMENLERIKEEHRFSMAAENIVGDLLERFVRYQPRRVGPEVRTLGR